PDHAKALRVYDPVQLTENLPEKDYTEKDTISILYLANYIQGKGQDAALEAFAKAYEQSPNIRLTFMGGDMGLEKNKLFKQFLEQRTNQLGLASVVLFAPFNSNIEQSIKEAEIVLNFSEAESFSMTCLEAAFYGTALIATRCGGPEEIIDHERTGITVPVKDINAMSAAILSLAGDAALRQQYAVAGKAYVKRKFSTGEYKQQMRQILTAAT
ncbi:MAG TPA: glycosyltransferase family 4 protein, partial [Flavipsychrobacter sp.]